jgi:A/G-specific adenine glycosylase
VAFPTVQALADAPLREVLALWSGLGYNSRAERLQRCAQTIVADFGGVVPSLPEVLLQLPGIGAYTSRSIPIFADNFDVATVDTNIRRIVLHEFGLPETLKPRELQMVANRLLPHGQSREWHNALMDYGALHLTSQKSGIRPLTRQSKFHGSRRWYRGQMLKALLKTEALPLEALEATWADSPYCLRDIASDLVREGLVEYHPSASADDSPLLRIRGNS